MYSSNGTDKMKDENADQVDKVFLKKDIFRALYT